jgi:hypothetical protein
MGWVGEVTQGVALGWYGSGLQPSGCLGGDSLGLRPRL